ncbi:MAG: HlyD family efflux transporter periplasmic adaptor subunit [Bacteroidales bacterium]|nr:HlyD family efflux transporter periplasmic adaptor subunit [Bacteroidales bacterium]
MNRFILFTILVISAACSNNSETSMQDNEITGGEREALQNIKEIIATGKIEPEGTIIRLAAPSGGIVKEIYRYEGATLKQGDPIALLDNDLERIRTDQLIRQAEAQEIQTALEKLALSETESRLKNRSELLESSERLAARGYEPLQNIKDLQTEVETLNLLAERQRMSVRLSMTRYDELQKQVRYAATEAEKKLLRAPADGILLNLSVRPGMAIAQFSDYAGMAPAGRIIVRAEVDELFADRIKEGQKVILRYPGTGKVMAEGEVFYLSPFLSAKSLFTRQTGEQEDRLVREIKIQLTGKPQVILNTKVECVITI